MNCECELRDCPYCYPLNIANNKVIGGYVNEYVPDGIPQGKLDNTIRRALNILDAWNSVTRVVEVNTSYYYELQSVIEDAVHCGIQAALNQYDALDSEINVALQDIVPFPPNDA